MSGGVIAAARRRSSNSIIPLTDAFARADSTTGIGTSPSGHTPILLNSGKQWGITSGQAYNAAGGSAEVVWDLGVADSSFSADLSGSSDTGLAIIARATDINNFYMMLVDPTTPAKFYKRVNGTFTVLATFGTYLLPARWTVEALGNTFTIKRDGLLIGTVTDSTYLTQTKFGLRADTGTTRFDNIYGGPITTESWTGADGASWPVAWAVKGSSGTVSSTIVGNQGRIAMAGTSARLAMQNDAMIARTDMDTTVSVTFTAQAGTAMLAIQADDAVVAGTFYPMNGYRMEAVAVGTTTSGQVYLSKVVNGVSTNLNQTFNNTIVAGTKYKMRLQKTGSVIRMKFWDASGAEPAAWKFSGATDAAISAPGKVRLGVGGNTGTAVDFDDLVVS